MSCSEVKVNCLCFKTACRPDERDWYMTDKDENNEIERAFTGTEEEKLVVGSSSKFKLFIEEIHTSIIDKINVTNLLLGSDNDTHKLPLNGLHCPPLFHFLSQWYFNILPMWTSLMLGDVKRHSQEYSDGSRFPAITIRCAPDSNRTNGPIEQRFKFLKYIYLPKLKRCRLDVFSNALYFNYLASHKQPGLSCIKRHERKVSLKNMVTLEEYWKRKQTDDIAKRQLQLGKFQCASSKYLHVLRVKKGRAALERDEPSFSSDSLIDHTDKRAKRGNKRQRSISTNKSSHSASNTHTKVKRTIAGKTAPHAVVEQLDLLFKDADLPVGSNVTVLADCEQNYCNNANQLIANNSESNKQDLLHQQGFEFSQSNYNNITDEGVGSNRPTSLTQNSLGTCSSIMPGCDLFTLVAPAWGEETVDDKLVRFTNTCPIDNFLFIFICILHVKPDLLQSGHCVWCTTFCTALRHDLNGNWNAAKYLWLKDFCGFTVTRREWDVHGTEYDMFIRHLHCFM